MADLFVSYAREDQGRVGALVALLEGEGWSVFWDRRIPPGETWRSYLGSALEGARGVVVAWSKHSIRSEWVIEEAEEARERGILIPVLIEAVLPPRGFRAVQAADLSGWRKGSTSPAVALLLAAVAKVLNDGRHPSGTAAGTSLQQSPLQGAAVGTPSAATLRWPPSLRGKRLIISGLAAALIGVSIIAVSILGSGAPQPRSDVEGFVRPLDEQPVGPQPEQPRGPTGPTRVQGEASSFSDPVVPSALPTDGGDKSSLAVKGKVLDVR